MSLKPEAIDRHAPISRKAIARLARHAKRAAARVRRRNNRANLAAGRFDECADRVTKGWAD